MILTNHKKLVVSGCSFTKGYGLADPENSSWPRVLANYFNLNCVNLAQEGAGNDYISNVAVEYAITHDPQECFFILAYSDFLRLDFCNLNDEMVHVTPSSRKWPSIRDVIYPTLANNNYLFKKFLLQVIKTQAWFEQNNISYMMVSGITTVNRRVILESDTESICNKISHNYKNFENINFNVIIREDGKLPDGHPNELGHQLIANTLKDWIKESN